jgi:hypothetical protein
MIPTSAAPFNLRVGAIPQDGHVEAVAFESFELRVQFGDPGHERP